MKPEIVVILCIFVAFSVLEMLFTRFFNKPGQTRDDIIVHNGLRALACPGLEEPHQQSASGFPTLPAR